MLFQLSFVKRTTYNDASAPWLTYHVRPFHSRLEPGMLFTLFDDYRLENQPTKTRSFPPLDNFPRNPHFCLISFHGYTLSLLQKISYTRFSGHTSVISCSKDKPVRKADD